MRIAIIGAGAVGSILGSLLWRAGEDVTLVGHAARVVAIRAAGLDVKGVLGGFRATPRAEERVSARPDLVLLTVSREDVAAALRDNAAMLDGVPIVIFQNGLGGERLAATVVPAAQLVSGVVSMHAHYSAAGHVVVVQSDGLLIGRPDGGNDEVVAQIRRVLDGAVPTSVSANIDGARWTKLIVNLNYVLPALAKASARQVFKDRFLRRLTLGLMRESVAVARRAGIRLEPLPGTSLPFERLVAWLPAMLAGAPAARKAARLESQWPREGPAWHGAARARATGIDDFNGEVVRLGQEVGVATPVNEFVRALALRAAIGHRRFTAREIERALRRRRMGRRRAILRIVDPRQLSRGKAVDGPGRTG